MSLLFLPILAQALSVSLGDTSEARVRSDEIGQHFDLVTTGRVALNLGLKRSRWTLYYSPSISQLNAGESDSALILYNMGGLGATLRLSPRTTVDFVETAGYGTENLRALAVAAPQANSGATTGTPGSANSAQPGTTGPTAGETGSNTGALGTPVLAAPAYATIKFGSVSSGAGVTQILDRKWAARMFASYTVVGGLDSYSESIIPRQSTYLGNTALSRLLGPRDQVVGTVLANYTLTEPTAVAFLSTITIAWNHRIDEWSTMSLLAGDAYTDSTGLDGTHYSGFLPVAGVTLTLTKARPLAGGRLSATFASKVAPMIDRLSGSVVQVLTTSAGASWTRRRLTLQMMGIGATAIGNQSQAVVTSNYGVTESATYRLDRRHWTVMAGSRQAYQRFSNATEPPLLWGAFISISYMTSVGHL